MDRLALTQKRGAGLMFHFGRAELLATTVAALVILTRIGLTVPLHPASVLRAGGTIPVASGGRVLTLAAL
jgi:hypothetical protein